MGEKQIDFNTPLLSVRRIAAKTGSKPRALGNPGLIPFTWEQTPGKPKRADGSKTGDDKLLELEDCALFSVNGSFSDCSVSSCGSNDGNDLGLKEGFSKNLEMQELMMERFLPASVAMATGPLEVSVPKESQRFGERRVRVPLPYQHRPVDFCKLSYDGEEIESYGDEDEGYRGVGHFSQACGLLPRFCLLNPLPRMKVRAADEESWDEQLEDGSKLTSESNQLTNWSDSPSYHHSPRSPFHERKGSVGVVRREFKGRKTVSFDWCDKIGEKYSKIRPLSVSPSIDRTPSSKSGSVDAVAETGDKGIEDSPVLESGVKDELQLKNYERVETGLSSSSERSNCDNDGQLVLEVEDKEKNGAGLELALLPPPLPQSPSESWLQRTLPSVSSKYQSPESLLGIQVQHRKQASWASSKDFIALKRQSQQTRFAQVLRKTAGSQFEP